MATRKVLKTTTTKPLPSKEKMEKQIEKIKRESMYGPDGTKLEGGGDKKKIAQWKKLDLVRRQTYGKEIKAENKALADKYGKHIQAGENIAAVKEGRTAMNVDGSGQRKRDAVATRKKIDEIGLAAYDQKQQEIGDINRLAFKNKKAARIGRYNNGQGMK